MISNMMKSQPYCYLNTFTILLVGWSSAGIIYLTAGGIVEDPLAEFENSRKYVYEVERMGGKAAVFAHDVSKWFDGLWHGESLAFTVAFITVLIASAYYFSLSDTSRGEHGYASKP